MLGPTSGQIQQHRPSNLAVRSGGWLRHHGVLLLAVLAAFSAAIALGCLPESPGNLGGSFGERSATFIEAVVHISPRADGADAINPTVYGIGGFIAFLAIIGLLRFIDLLLARLRRETPFSAAQPSSVAHFGLEASGQRQHESHTSVSTPAQRSQVCLPELPSPEQQRASDSTAHTATAVDLLASQAPLPPASSQDLRHPELLEVHAVAVTQDARARLRPHFSGIRRRSGEHRLSNPYAGPFRRATDRPTTGERPAPIPAAAPVLAPTPGSQNRESSCLDLET